MFRVAMRRAAAFTARNASIRHASTASSRTGMQWRTGASILGATAGLGLAASLAKAAATVEDEDTPSSFANPLESEEYRYQYPPLQPYNSGTLRVSEVHEIYYEESGNPNGKVCVQCASCLCFLNRQIMVECF